MDISRLSGTYTVTKEEVLPEVNGKGYILSHNKTKARICVIENDDNNKVFSIGFRTPPTNSKGIQHIVEHTVLCGSDKYPVKDPFVELAKGSLNTFLNAMTYPDKTVYPVASCNVKDFRNLMEVYLDAVFHPNIYKYEEIFKQEGWHYELTDKEAPLTINGVVYNEMRGVYSSPESCLARAVTEHLYPDSVYSLDSGGDPEVIPTLTREEYLDYHANYYHPSNSYIYLYGDKDFADELLFIDSEYLSGYDYLYVPSEIKPVEEFKEPVDAVDTYSLSDSESLEDNTFLSYNVVTKAAEDNKVSLAMNILTYVLLEIPGAPLKEAIIESGICQDVDGSFENELLDPFFSIVARNSNKEDKDKFNSIIEDTLRKIADEGINKKSLKAAISHFEFKHKEANAGRFPKGLLLGLGALGDWLYDDERALDIFSRNHLYTELKELVETDYFENLIRTLILDNPHKAFVTFVPEYGLNKKKDDVLNAKLAEYKQTLSDEELDKIIADTVHLKAYQEEPSSDEDLARLPLLELSDIGKEARRNKNTEYDVDEIPLIHHDIFTNGISYVKLFFDISDFTKEELSTVSLLTELFEYVDTDNFKYSDLASEVDIAMGGSAYGTGTYKSLKNDGFISGFSIKFKCFDENVKDAFKLIEEIFFRSHITDRKRLKEIIAESKAGMKAELLETGHLTSSQRAESYISPGFAKKEYTEGIEYYRFIDRLDKNFDDVYEDLARDIQAVFSKLARRAGLIVSVTSGKNPVNEMGDEIREFASHLNDNVPGAYNEFVLGVENEGFRASSQVQYVATAGNYKKAGFDYSGYLSVLQIIFSYDYLWINVRVQGGAYGSMCGFSRSGMGYFTSYRDPNLANTYEVYKNAYKYVENFDVSDRDMLKYIIGTISKLDTPLGPSAEGDMSFIYYLAGITDEMTQKERDEVLSTTPSKIRDLAPLIKAITDSDIICVVGGEEAVDAAKDMFGKVDNLY